MAVAAAVQISSCLCYYSSLADNSSISTAKIASSARISPKFGTAFATGAPLVVQRSFYRRSCDYGSKSLSIRCEQSSSEGSSGLDVWIGRLAMVSFATAVTAEIATGKGPLENLGIITPLPTVALAVTVLVAVLVAYFIFQSSASKI